MHMYTIPKVLFSLLERRNMTSKLLLLMPLLFLCIHHLSALPLGRVEEYDEAIAIGQQNRFSHGTIGGNPAVNGGNGESHSPNVQGAGGVTPLYAAAAAGSHRPHHGGGSRHEGRIGLGILAVITVAWFLL